MPRLRYAGPVLDTFWKLIAIKHGEAVEEFAQHTPRRQAGKAPPDNHCVRSPHNVLRVLGRKVAPEQASAAKAQFDSSPSLRDGKSDVWLGSSHSGAVERRAMLVMQKG